MVNDESSRLEQKGLRLSVIGALGMAALGIGFSFSTGSQAVLLDGLFSLIGFAIGLVAMWVATMVARPGDELFHFGYATYEPMLNLVKGLLIAFVTLVAFLSAISTIIDGGREVQGGMAIVYAVVACVGCLAISFAQRRIGKRTDSPLLDVDAQNWMLDGLISGAVAVAFVVVVLLRASPFASWVPYADPAIVILLVVLSAPIPVKIVKENWNQLLGRAPGTELQQEARQRVTEAVGKHPGLTPHIRLLQTGRHVYVQLYVTVGAEASATTVEELDLLRSEIHQEVTRGEASIGLDVIFTRDPVWIGRSVGAREARSGERCAANHFASPQKLP